MKFRRLEPRPRRVPAKETLGVLEREEDDLYRLLNIWRNPEVQQHITTYVRSSMNTWAESKQLYFNLVSVVRDLTLLNNAFGEPAVAEEIQEQAKTLVRSHEIFNEPLGKSTFVKAGTPRIFFWSDLVTVFPEERSRIVVPDEIFIQWLEKYSKDPKLIDSFKAELFARMAILKPEKILLCREKFLEVEPNFWRDRANLPTRQIRSLAACRILFLDSEFSSDEKSRVLDRLDPKFDQGDEDVFRFQPEVFAAAAVLLAPKIEIDGLGNIVFKSNSWKPQTSPLPDRPNE